MQQVRPLRQGEDPRGGCGRVFTRNWARLFPGADCDLREPIEQWQTGIPEAVPWYEPHDIRYGDSLRTGGGRV